MGPRRCLFGGGSIAEGATKSLDINSEVSIVRYGQGIRIKFNREFRAGVLQIPIPVRIVEIIPTVYASRKKRTLFARKGSTDYAHQRDSLFAVLEGLCTLRVLSLVYTLARGTIVLRFDRGDRYGSFGRSLAWSDGYTEQHR